MKICRMVGSHIQGHANNKCFTIYKTIALHEKYEQHKINFTDMYFLLALIFSMFHTYRPPRLQNKTSKGQEEGESESRYLGRTPCQNTRIRLKQQNCYLFVIIVSEYFSFIRSFTWLNFPSQSNSYHKTSLFMIFAVGICPEYHFVRCILQFIQ